VMTKENLTTLIETGWTNMPLSRCSFCGKDWNAGVGHEHGQGGMDPDPPYGFIVVHEDKGGTIKFDAEKAADAVLAYVATAVTQAVQEYRTKARGSMATDVECDLCEEVVTEWEWVDKGWSLACRPCLDKIRAQAMERCAEIAEGFESPFSQEFPAEAWRGKLQTVILQALLGAPRDGDDTQPERAVAEAVFSFLQTGRDRMDELFQTGNASAAIRAEAIRRAPAGDRCLITGHPVGTDTRPVGQPCPCASCSPAKEPTA
jgi:hypothetical protein